MGKDSISRTIAYALRHKPDKLGLTLDQAGWASVDELLLGLANEGQAISVDVLREIVASDDKQRYTLSEDGLKIRAAQGHSAIRISYPRKRPPAVLYHGTHTEAVESIERTGLEAGRRHYVHLSATVETAEAVGRRRGQPVVLIISAAAMSQAGHPFYLAENGVWLANDVPARFITRLNPEAVHAGPRR